MPSVTEKAVFILSVICLLTGSKCLAQNQVTVAESGKVTPVIVVSPEPEEQVQLAVQDLQHYLHRMTGMEIPVAQSEAPGKYPIYVGKVPANVELEAAIAQKELGREGFVLDISEKGLRILGGSKYGTAYGVYELLERMGVRWLFPNEWGEVVPRRKTITLAAGRFSDKPAFLIREMHSWTMGAPSQHRDWLRRQRENASGFGGHSSLMLKYREEHPEWFAEIDGKRQNDAREPKLCHSNQQMVNQAIKDVLSGIRERKESDYFVWSISPTDGGGFCRCAECEAMGPLSDRVQIFANTIAEEVAKEFPDYYVGYYGAYSEHSAPPTVKAHPNVIVFMTTWAKNFFQTMLESGNQGFREKVEAFAEKCPNLAIRDYDGMFTCWWGWGPVSLIEVHEVDYPWYHKRGVMGFITEAQDHWAAAGQSYYVMNKLWWNPYADVEAIKRDFVQTGFGEAFEPMWRYYERINEERRFLLSGTLLAMRHDLEEAAGLAKREDVKRRIDFLRLYHLMLDADRRGPMGKMSNAELLQAARIGQSLVGKNIVGKQMCDVLIELYEEQVPEAERQAIEPFTDAELGEILWQMEIPEAQPELSQWVPADDQQLVPLSEEPSEFRTSMGVSFRYGPNTVLIYAKSGERIEISQDRDSETSYELSGPEQSIVSTGIISSEKPLGLTATTEGIYTLTINSGGRWVDLQIGNRWAVTKASSLRQNLHPIGPCTLYFYIPEGTQEFAFVGKADKGEPYQLTIWGPHDAETPVFPETLSPSTNFEEHRVKVPAGTDGKIWRLSLKGEDKEFFLLGIPPFLAGDPGRLMRKR